MFLAAYSLACCAVSSVLDMGRRPTSFAIGRPSENTIGEDPDDADLGVQPEKKMTRMTVFKELKWKWSTLRVRLEDPMSVLAKSVVALTVVLAFSGSIARSG